MPGPDYIPPTSPEEDERRRKFFETLFPPDIERLTEKIKEIERDKEPA